MRVAWVVPGFQGGDGEPGIPALNSLARAIGSEHDLHVFAVRYPLRSARYRSCGTRVQSFGEALSSHSGVSHRVASARRWARVLATITSVHSATPFAVIHGFWATESGMLAVAAGRMLRLPVLLSCCGGELAAARPAGYGSRLRILEKMQVALSLHASSTIGVGSMDLRERLLFRYPWLTERIEMLPLGYDPQIFPAKDEPAERNRGRIVCVAAWSPVKGHDLLLDSLRVLVRRGVSADLQLVGERTDGPEARAAVARRGLQCHVDLVGVRSQAEVAKLLGSAHVAAIASWHEAQCLAVVEALACGVPVVSTPVGIARELLSDRTVGICVTSRSPDVLADALERRLRWEPLYGDHARRRRQEVVAHLSLPVVARRFLRTYEGLAAGNQTRGVQSDRR